MPIIKYVAVHGSLLKLLKYVTDENKTEDTLITGLNCSADARLPTRKWSRILSFTARKVSGKSPCL